MNNAEKIIGFLGVSATAMLLSHAPIKDSYREAVLARQLTKGKAWDGCHKPSNIAITSDVANDAAVTLAPKDMLQDFKNGGLPISAIATIMGVERKTIYAWLDGSPLKLANEDRVSSVYQVLNEGKTASYRNLYRYMSKKVDGHTLLDVLSDDSFDEQLAKSILTKLWPMAERIEKSLASDDKKAGDNNPLTEEMEEAYIS